ncbi:unnamed protein product [Caenorhabditis auriculariae]|uniref:Uncharacterized protein n=1 Tax=Caenorhabditis auriculariae TaxID=2777116 RepID=A0A8S1HG85_9PELO|nr:unnamed protein product [Caenorhabditis auriculariae]
MDREGPIIQRMSIVLQDFCPFPARFFKNLLVNSYENEATGIDGRTQRQQTASYIVLNFHYFGGFTPFPVVIFALEALAVYSNNIYAILFFLIWELIGLLFLFFVLLIALVMFLAYIGYSSFEKKMSFERANTLTLSVVLSFMLLLTCVTWHSIMLRRIYRHTKKTNDRYGFIMED